MRIPNTPSAHLTYCLNVHPGSTLEEAETGIFERAKAVFSRFSAAVGAAGPYGLGLWLSADAAHALEAPGRLDAFAARIESAGFYVFTLNGFPYSRFHGVRVKERVYQPDWADPARRDYTLLLARILARLLPEGVRGTISTLPVTYKPWVNTDKLDASARHIAEVAAALATLRRQSGKDIALALEPEPGCFLERTEDVLDFEAAYLAKRGGDLLRQEHGLGAAEATQVLRRHVGICLDTTHAGVMFENPTDILARLTTNRIRVSKIQLGAALKVQVGKDGPPDALRAFQDEVYLHQVMVATAEGKRYFADLPDALAEGKTLRGEWRVHFHVPLSWPGDGPIATTSPLVDSEFLNAALRAGCEHFESEIYTLDVFPGLRGSAEAVLAQDLAWLWERLTQR